MLQKAGLFLLLLHKGSSRRYWEVDALRGLAIALMVIYHLAFDLTYFGHYHANVFTGGWRVFGRVSACLFLLLVGVSLAISFVCVSPQRSGWSRYTIYLTRGLKLVGWGMVITLTTWIFMGEPVILFGILHLIGTAVMLAYPFLWLPPLPNLALGIAVIWSGLFLNTLPAAHLWLLWLGLRPPALYQADYFPLLPWFGVVLVGISIGQLLYPDGRRRFHLPGLGTYSVLQKTAWMGRHSLIIYLAHQPVLFAALTLVGTLQ